MQLSKHFTLSEFTKSLTAERAKINNNPPHEAVTNLKNLCKEILEPIRKEIGMPIYINSGFRSESLNKLVGGIPNSYHLFGRAADIRSSDIYKLKETVANMVESKIIIPTEYIEYPTFIHLAL